jgi:hypothetical protein
LVHLDDTLFDAQCSADAQTTNTAAMLEAFERIWRDGRLDDDDAPDLCYLRRHTLLEHRWNGEQGSLLDKARDGVAGAGRVIQDLRGRIQEMRRATREVALQAPSKAHMQINGNAKR